MPIQYMTKDGVWLSSCEDGTDPPDGAILAPADAAGFHGMDGLRWDGKAWVLYTPPPDPKWAGIEFEGVMCSATAEDQAGLAAVLLAVQLQGAAFKPTRFYFSNGSTLVLHLGNFQTFAATWLPFRQSFFAVD